MAFIEDVRKLEIGVLYKYVRNNERLAFLPDYANNNGHLVLAQFVGAIPMDFTIRQLDRQNRAPQPVRDALLALISKGMYDQGNIARYKPYLSIMSDNKEVLHEVYCGTNPQCIQRTVEVISKYTTQEIRHN